MIRSFIAALLLVAALPSSAQVFGGNPSGSVSSTGGTYSGPVVGPGFFPPAQDFIFYVDPTGSDSNNCTAAITPCLTLQAAVAKLPPQWKQKARIILAAGTYTITGVYNLRVGTPIGAGEPVVIQGVMEDSGLGERTITGVTTYGSGYVVSVTDDTLAPTLDQWEGYFLRMTTCAAGAGCVGMQRIIRGNTTGGQFDLNVGSTSATVKPAIGDKFVIERPSSVIAYDNVIKISSSGLPKVAGQGYGGGTSMILNKLRFVGSGSSSALSLSHIDIWVNTVSLYGANFGAYIDAVSSLFADYRTGITSDEIIGTIPTYGSGMYLSMSTGNYCLAAQGSTIDGWYVGRNCGISGRYNSDVRLYFLSLRGNQGVAIYNNSRIATASATYGPLGQISGAGILLQGSISGPTHLKLSEIVISSSPSAGIKLEGQSLALLKDVTGTANTGSGISVMQGSYLLEDTGNTIAGTTSEILVGAQITTHAAIAAGTPLIVPPHGTVTKYGGTTDYPYSGTNTGDVTLGAVGSTPNANGATLTGQVWNAQPADATYPGVVTASAQTFAGSKMFAAPITLTPSALGTCGTAPNTEGTVVAVAGVTTVPTKMCFCTYTPTGTTYAWQNITGTFATSAASIGNTTTCPDSAL
jgi:hypothetical protein